MSEQTEATAMEEQTTTKKAKALATDTLAILLVFALTFAALTYWFGTANAQGGGSTNGTDDAGTATAAQEPEYEVELVEWQRGTADADSNGTTETALVGFAQGKTLMPVTVEKVMDELDGFGLPTAANYVDKIVTAKNAGTENAYIRIIVAVPAALDDFEGFHLDFGDAFNEKISEQVAVGFTGSSSSSDSSRYFNVNGVPITVSVDNSSHTNNYNLYVFTSKSELNPNQSTQAAIVGMYLDSTVTYDASTDTYSNGSDSFSGAELSEYLAIPVVAQVASSNEALPWEENAWSWSRWMSDALSAEDKGSSLNGEYGTAQEATDSAE